MKDTDQLCGYRAADLLLQKASFLMARLNSIIYTEVCQKIYFFINLFDCFISVLRPGKKFFCHVGTKPPLPGYYQYFWGENISCSRKQHGDPSGDGTFRNLNFSNVISSKFLPDMLKYEIILT